MNLRIQTTAVAGRKATEEADSVALPTCLSYQLLGCVPAASCVDSRVIALSICHMKGEETGVPKKADRK